MRVVVAFVAGVVLSCAAGQVLSGTYTFDGELSEGDRLLLEAQLTSKGCPEVRKNLGKDCDANTIRTHMREMCVYWPAEVEGDLTYEVTVRIPE